MKGISLMLYKFSDMNKGSQILLFLIILIALMLICITIINFITKKKNIKYDVENRNMKKYSDLIGDSDIEPDFKMAPVDSKVTRTKPIVDEEIEELDISDIKIEENEVVEIVSKPNSIEEISKLIEDTLEQEPIDLTKFEEDQEKDAIISYDELVKRAGAKKIIYKTENKEEKIEEVKDENKNEYNTTFKASKIVSPIYGIQKEKVPEEVLEIEELKLDDVDEEMQRDVDFLGNLKTFRNNLD